jgi:hypothetical protein
VHAEIRTENFPNTNQQRHRCINLLGLFLELNTKKIFVIKSIKTDMKTDACADDVNASWSSWLPLKKLGSQGGTQ